MPKKISEVKIRKLEDMRKVLMNPQAEGPESVYAMVRGQPNITVLVPGKIGKEFTKTHGHYHQDDRSETYRVLFGEGKMLIQDRDTSDVRLLEMKAGEEVAVPEGYAHTMINTGDGPLVTADDCPSDAETNVNDYEPIKEKQGFALYVVEEDGEVETVPNVRYDSLE
jgi:glucose-6-phosphate isomerase